MFDEFLFATAVILGVTFVRLARRRTEGGRGYLIAVSVVLACALAAAVRDSRFLGVVAMAMTMLVVVVPWVLEYLARAAFGRGRLRLAVAFAGVRALLMPGAGLTRQQQILRGLAVLERDGVDEALSHFHGLVDEAEDGGELALINEQIVSMLFYGQRWEEGVALYEARFHPSYAAMRPTLALGLLRAYGESHHLDRAADLLQALEEGPIGNDPRALGLVSQARLTFLAYAGAARTVEGALTERRREVLGLSAASSALFVGIAHLRAGDRSQAQRAWEDVPRLAGAADDRVVDASRRAIAALDGYGETAAIDLDPDLQSYVDAVAERLNTFLSAAPKVSRRLPRFGAPVLIGATLLGYLGFLGLDRGGYGLLDLGAMAPVLWAAGQWFRLASGAWSNADPISMLLNVYVLWMAAPLFERVHGTGRLLLTALGGAAVGLLVAAGLHPGSVDVISGGHLLSTSVLAGSIWTLLPIRSPRFPSRARRALLVPLLFLLAAQSLCLVPGLLALQTPVAGFAAAVGVGVLVAMISGLPGRVLGWMGVAVALVHLAALGAAFVGAEGGRGTLAETTLVSTPAGTVKLPRAFVPVQERRDETGLGLPLVPGAVDAVALRGGAVVQVLVAQRAQASTELEAPIVVTAAPDLRNALTVVGGADVPPTFGEALAEAGVDDARIFALRGNSEAIGLVVERQVGSTVWSLVATPPSALEEAPSVYAAALAGAHPVDPE